MDKDAAIPGERQSPMLANFFAAIPTTREYRDETLG